MNTPWRPTSTRVAKRPAPRRAGLLACALSLIASMGGREAVAAPFLNCTDESLVLTVNAGPLFVGSPGKFEIAGHTRVPAAAGLPSKFRPIAFDDPGDRLMTLPSEGRAGSQDHHSIELFDVSGSQRIQYTLRFALLPGSCPALSASSIDSRVLVERGRRLAFSVLRRPIGNPTGPQLISSPKSICVNPQADVRLIFNPMVDHFLPIELETVFGDQVNLTELSVPL